MNKPKRQQPAQQNDSQKTQSVIHAQKTTVYRGQLPPPEMLEKFEAIHPGFTNRLLKMVEDESEFKRSLDREMFKSFKISSVMGIIFAFLSVLVISCVAIYAIYKGFGTASASIMATCVVGVIIAFIQRRKRTKAD